MAARLLAGSVATAAAAVLLGPAVPAASADSCPNAAVRVGPSAELPGCRAYEHVTPPDKQGSNDMFLNRGAVGTVTKSMAANGGDRVLLTTSAAFGPSPDGLTAIPYVFSRSQSGWALTPVQPPGAGITHYSLVGGIFRPDLSRVAPLSFTGSAVGSDQTIELVFGAPGGPYTTITTVARADDPNFAAATPDFGHIFFRARDYSLVPPAGDLAAGDAIYAWTDGELRLVNRMSDGSLTSPCGAMLGGPRKSNGFAHNAVSSDGSRVFFVSPDPFAGGGDPSCDEPQRLYMRVNGTEAVHVSEPDPGVEDPDGFQPVTFAGAADDGSRVFLVTETNLTADTPTQDEHPELYEYHVPSGDLTRVSGGAPGDAEGNVQWALPSEDASTVYFAAFGQLAPGAPELPLPPDPEADKVNLYSYDTATETTRYIVTLPANAGTRARTAEGNWYTTPNGRFLVFASEGNLAGYDPGNCVDPHHGCQQLYRYDSGDGSLTCVSCPATSPAIDAAEFTGFLHGPDWPDVRPPRPISDDGSHVFFDTPEALVPGDVNGHRRDVYLWREDGSPDGKLSLISSGADPVDALFVDSSSDGRDVFFGTHAQLAPTDTDFAGDLYDARVGGGFPVPPERPPCSGADCKAPASPSPSAPPAGTTAFAGPGSAAAEPPARRCKTLDRRHNRAKRNAKKLRRKSRRLERKAKREHGKRARKLARRAKKQQRRANNQRRKARKAKRQARRLGCEVKRAGRSDCARLERKAKRAKRRLHEARRADGRRARRLERKVDDRRQRARRLKRRARRCERGRS